MTGDGLKRSFEGLNLLFAPYGQGFGLEIAVWLLIALGLRGTIQISQISCLSGNSTEELVEHST